MGPEGPSTAPNASSICASVAPNALSILEDSEAPSLGASAAAQNETSSLIVWTDDSFGRLISQQRNLLSVVKPVSLDLVARSVSTLIRYGGVMYTVANTCTWQHKGF